MQGAQQEWWAKGQPDEAVFFGPVENSTGVACGKLCAENQKSRQKPIDNSRHVRYNGSIK